MKNEEIKNEKEEALLHSLTKIECDNRKNSQENGIGKDEYYALFFKIPTESARKGKSVYLRHDYHYRFTRLISALGIEKLTIYAYVDNIIEYHFKKFEEVIQEIYEEKNSPLF